MLPQALRRVPARPGGLPAVGGAEPKQTATSPGSGTSRRYRAVAASTSRPGGLAVRASGRAAGPPGAAFHARQSGSLRRRGPAAPGRGCRAAPGASIPRRRPRSTCPCEAARCRSFVRRPSRRGGGRAAPGTGTSAAWHPLTALQSSGPPPGGKEGGSGLALPSPPGPALPRPVAPRPPPVSSAPLRSAHPSPPPPPPPPLSRHAPRGPAREPMGGRAAAAGGAGRRRAQPMGGGAAAPLYYERLWPPAGAARLGDGGEARAGRGLDGRTEETGGAAGPGRGPSRSAQLSGPVPSARVSAPRGPAAPRPRRRGGGRGAASPPSWRRPPGARGEHPPPPPRPPPPPLPIAPRPTREPSAGGRSSKKPHETKTQPSPKKEI